MSVKLILVGLGNQVYKDHFPAIIKNKDAELIAICDLDRNKVLEFIKNTNIRGYPSLNELLKFEKNIDAALVVLPHDQYLPVIRLLAERKINILKEKPLARNIKEAEEIVSIVENSGIKMMITVQRRFSDLYKIFNLLKNSIGNIYSIYIEYSLSLFKLDKSFQGWRADKEKSGGGAVLDLGYHVIDLLVWLFGLPNNISSIISYNSLPNQDYQTEDTAKILFDYTGETGNKIGGSALMSKIYSRKGEKFQVFGSEGIISLEDNTISLLDLEKNIIESHTYNNKKQSVQKQFDYFIDCIKNNKKIESDFNYKTHINHMKFIDSVYIADRKNETIHLK